MKPIVVVGAGITGCVISQQLAKRGFKVILVEKCPQIGGLAKTFQYGDFSFDVGPHRFHTQKQQISTFIRSILKNEHTLIFRKSGVYFWGKYYSWPLRPADFFSFPLKISFKSAWDLLLLILKDKKRETGNFEDYILRNYGPTLYNVFFKEYTQKFLGLSPRKTHSEWAREGMKRTIIDERLASRHLLDIAKTAFMSGPIQTKFIYPIGGVSLFCRRLVEEFKKNEGEVLINSVITNFKCSSEKIEEISLNGISIKPEKVIWTASVTEICRLLKLSSCGLKYLSLVLYNVELNRPVKREYQWCYYGSEKIIFSRTSFPVLFNENMAPKNKTGLCVEVTCCKNDQRWNNPEILLPRMKKDLIKVGLIDGLAEIENIHIEKVSDAYPIYSIDYSQNLEKVRQNLSKFKNFVLAGRTGLFWYNNMDDCIENALKVAEDILQGNRASQKRLP